MTNDLFSNMQETKRQRQVAQLVQEEISRIFQRAGINIFPGGGMVSVSKVQVTPDLLEARIYLSLFQIKDQPALMKDIQSRMGEWRNALGQQVKHQLRRVPELEFFTDESMDYAFHMEGVFDRIHKQDEERKKNNEGG